MKRILMTIATLATLTVAANAAEVDWRLHNERARIEQGERSGRLSYWQAESMEHRANAIRREINADRYANGGHLTPGEWRALNRQENRLSERIYDAKHPYCR